jgi:hypothetical protein
MVVWLKKSGELSVLCGRTVELHGQEGNSVGLVDDA